MFHGSHPFLVDRPTQLRKLKNAEITKLLITMCIHVPPSNMGVLLDVKQLECHQSWYITVYINTGLSDLRSYTSWMHKHHWRDILGRHIS